MWHGRPVLKVSGYADANVIVRNGHPAKEQLLEDLGVEGLGASGVGRYLAVLRNLRKKDPRRKVFTQNVW